MIKSVNGGILKNINGLNIEILSHNFHNPNCNIICTYYLDKGKKIELTYYKYLDNIKQGNEVYLFKNANELQHYKSYNYNRNNIPKKYKELADKLKDIFLKINFDEYKN